ncbi:MAG: helix-turn-helix domain-containing protein [Spirochaetaceae bacterium]|jgi:transcriptional regulator with XRE-family HTH domain|nr:helix-turn-helix domain-containing protein [Spirochaetaceae bacterium]
MNFNENLREKWILSGLEQKELAVKAGFSLKTLENYIHENSETMPSADKAFKMAQALGTTVEELFTGKPLEKPPDFLDVQFCGLQRFARALERLEPSVRKFVLKQALDLAEFLLKD